MLIFALTFAGLWALLLVTAYLFQEHLMFVPHKLAPGHVYSFSGDWERQWFKTDDGEHIEALWFRPAAGVLVVEDEQPYLDLAIASPYEQLAGAPIRYVIAAGPQAGSATMRLRDPVLAIGASGARSCTYSA
jgi:hypothetical protein